MKKICLLSALLLLGACENISQYTATTADSTPRQKMQACMLNEANNRLYNGTLFVNTVSETAKDITNTCLKKLALQAAGISEESQTAATNVINNLKTLSNN